MLNEASRCSKCGKMFAPHPGKTMCARCAAQFAENVQRVKEAAELHGDRTIEEVAAYAGLTVDDVKTILQDPLYEDSGYSDSPLCTRCKEKPAQKHSEYCLSCRLELNKAFGHAARTLASQIEREITDRRTAEKIKRASALREVERKRAANPMTRMTNPPNRYSR